MKVIILAAGRGTRLKDSTKNIPKSLVKLNNNTLISYQIKNYTKNRCKKIYISTGYKSYCFDNLYLKKIYNRKYQSTNMVYTLINTLKKIKHDEDLIISYGDILFNSVILKKLINSREQFTVVVDLNFLNLWNKRFINPIKDLETLKIKKNKILEIGNRPNDLNDIEGQYLGLIKINKKFIKKFINFFENFDSFNPHTIIDKNNISMTSFINLMIKNKYQVTSLNIKNGWLEVDNQSDLKKYQYYNLINKYKINL